MEERGGGRKKRGTVGKGVWWERGTVEKEFVVKWCGGKGCVWKRNSWKGVW